MGQLREIKHVWQKEPGIFKRWFTDDNFWDIYVWSNPHDEIVGVQICYDKHSREKAITWLRDKIFDHTNVNSIYRNRTSTPILMPDEVFHNQDLLEKFINDSKNLEKHITTFIIQKFDEFEHSDAQTKLYTDFKSNKHYSAH